MKRYHLKKPETYTHKGEEKTFWHEVGSLVIFDDGKGKIKVPAIGLEAQVFPIEERTVETAPKVEEPKALEHPEDEINPQDIPF